MADRAPSAERGGSGRAAGGQQAWAAGGQRVGSGWAAPRIKEGASATTKSQKRAFSSLPVHGATVRLSSLRFMAPKKTESEHFGPTESICHQILMAAHKGKAPLKMGGCEKQVAMFVQNMLGAPAGNEQFSALLGEVKDLLAAREHKRNDANKLYLRKPEKQLLERLRTVLQNESQGVDMFAEEAKEEKEAMSALKCQVIHMRIESGRLAADNARLTSELQSWAADNRRLTDEMNRLQGENAHLRKENARLWTERVAAQALSSLPHG